MLRRGVRPDAAIGDRDLDLDLPLGYTVVPPPVADLPSRNHSIFVEVGLDTGDPSLAAHRLEEVVALLEGTPSSMSVVRRWSERRADREKAFSDWRRRAHAADLRRAVQSLLPGGCTT